MLKVVRAERGQGSGRGAPRVPSQAFHGGGRAGGRGHRGQAGREAVCRDCHRKQTMTVGAALEASCGAVGVTGPGTPTRGCARGAWTLGVACAPRCRGPWCHGPWCRGRGGAEAGGSGRPPGAGHKAMGLRLFSSVASAPCLIPWPSGWVPIAGPTHPQFAVPFVSAGGAAWPPFPCEPTRLEPTVS